MSKKLFSMRLDDEYIEMLDAINDDAPFKTSYAEIIRSLIKVYYLKINNDVNKKIIDEIQYEVKEFKFTNPDK